MDKYFKNINSDGYIESISTGAGKIEITEDEYNAIMNVIICHVSEEGKGYHLLPNLTWEEYDVEDEDTEEYDEMTLEEALEALADAEYKLCLYELGMEEFLNDL